MSDIKPELYEKKTFVVEVVQVTLENMPAVIKWVNDHGGSATLDQDQYHRPFVHVDVNRPANEKQTRAYVGDRVLRSTSGFRIYTEPAFHKAFVRTEKPMDPYQTQNVFDRPDADRKVVKEKPVGDEKLIQGESVEVSPVAPKDLKESRSPFGRTPEEIREAHRTGASGFSPATEAKRREAFKQEHGRYPGEFAGSLEQAYEGHPGLTNDLGETLEQWSARVGHGPTENPDPEH